MKNPFPDPTMVARREGVDPDSPNALRNLATEFRTAGRKAASKAETLRDRMSYAEDPNREKSYEDLKGEWSYYHSKAGRLKQTAKELEKRAREIS